MKTYIGTVMGARDRVVDMLVDGRKIELRAGTQVALEAIAMIGRRVRFAAELSEATASLHSPVFVIGSSYGIRAMGVSAGAADAAEAAE